MRADLAALFEAAGRASAYRSAVAGLKPEPHMRLSEWAETYRCLAEEASAQPGPWRNDIAPYLVEPMDRSSPDDLCEEEVIMKCVQSGGSAAAENFLGYVMHRSPGPAMYIQTTIQAAKDWKREKLDPTIRASAVLNPAMGGVVAAQKTRSGEGTTAQRINFRGGYLLLAGSNSAASLRQHSIRYMVKDDLDGWAESAGDEGDPDMLADGRITTYRTFGLSKVLSISSPKLKGLSRIERKYEASDKRRYYMGCPRCGHLTDWDWEDVQKGPPPAYRCHVVCPHCAAVLPEAEKKAMLALGRWIPTAPDGDGVVPPKTIAPAEVTDWADRETGRLVPGYNITGVITAFERWSTMARLEAEAGDDPALLQPFVNNKLGRTWEGQSASIAWEILSARREADWHRNGAPPGPVYFTLAADVQAVGIYFETVGWAPRKESWLVDHGFLPGLTDSPGEGAWVHLAEILQRGVRLADGTRVPIDISGVDTGYNAEAAYSFVRRRHNCHALKGVKSWTAAAIAGAETPDVRKTGLSAGKARKAGLKVWLVGGWGLKAQLMVYLGRDKKETTAGAGMPSGYCHFPGDAEDDYFKQITAEYVVVEREKGEPVRRWKSRGDNHYLDCRVYNLALTYFAGLWAWGEDRWDKQAGHLASTIAQATPSTPDLFGAPPPIAVSAGLTDDADATPREEAVAAPAPTTAAKAGLYQGL